MEYFITVEPGVRVFVQDLNPTGNRTILFIHGWPLSHKQFEYQFDILPSLGVRCIGMDWRGFGNSDKPFTGYSLDRLSDDIRVVIETLKLQNITLAGHSAGGALAIRYLARHQSFGVSKLVLIDAQSPGSVPQQDANRFIAGTLSDRPQMLAGLTDSFFFKYITEPFSNWFFQIGLQAAGWSTAAVMVTLRDENVRNDLGKINVPTLIINGVHDKVVPFTNAQETNKLIRNSFLVPFQYSGHVPFLDERDNFNQTLMQFIQ
ncbi:pimeloyl-ACP methyl ester carboxylesterase [Paenibacillus endophyticus]|uniref:Pimeloyl-ACP methyl ester carboxylesterase n=1 Tax=Paenibacillus endophyticus TaxID=1294268 RepID=A0A7W5C5H6_9BACL|nr:alpha/beta hydrolase [Paenibacillus endophyticus]MBB3151064.1 pimeloyl-ACP methyl ester carboxylesterase [Paenibacillus endophyticus]